MRHLTHIGVINREREPGSRRERYSTRTEQWYESFGRHDQITAHWEQTLRSGVDIVGADTPAGRGVAETAGFFAFLRGEIGANDRAPAHPTRPVGRRPSWS